MAAFATDHKKTIVTKIKDEALIEKKRKLIIKTAAKLFSKKGFHKTTLYNYIREKEDILFLMHEYYQMMFMKQIDMAIQQETDIKSRSENVFKNLLALSRQYQKEIRLIFIETSSQTKVSLKVLLNRQSALIERIEGLIAAGVNEKIFKVKNPRLAASVINYLIFYQSLNGWDIKKMGLTDDQVEEYLLSCIYGILNFECAPGKR